MVSIGWQQLRYQTQTCKYLKSCTNCTVYIKNRFHLESMVVVVVGGVNVGRLCVCVELYPSLRCKNVLTVHKHSDSTWKRMSQWSQVDKKKEKQPNISPRRYAAETPSCLQYGIRTNQPPLSDFSSFKAFALNISCGLRTLQDDVL